MTTLHDGFRNRARRRFLPGRNGTDKRIESDVLPGVIVHVLGPSHDESVIRDMEPPAGKSYLRLMSGADPGVPDVPQPFEDWIFADAAYKKSYPHLALPTPYQKQLQDIGDDFAQAVAVSLDKAVNGTSLMLVFKIGRVHLLFPGDAQWDTWRSALDHAESRALLRKAEFYKVGHHGSHNATPIEFVEKVFHKDSWTMTSVRPVAKWKSIPRKPLLEALGKKTRRLVRSDRADAAARAGFRVAPLYVEATIPLR
ncbi:MAG TPA: hypothetical protein VK864_01500, partial [Longimicrobiales bacterium]|nr:hypothetical protein [Longimicrobiales bacterium]